jgi:hypothetical protein
VLQAGSLTRSYWRLAELADAQKREQSMASEAQRGVCRQNPKRSTRPRSATGTARSSKNAVPDGLLAALPVPPGESAAEWRNHRAGVLQSLAPVGTVEVALAERVALCLWRLGRVAAYETAGTGLGLDQFGAEGSGSAGGALHSDAVGERTLFLQSPQEELEESRRTFALWERVLAVMKGSADIPEAQPFNGRDVRAVLFGLKDWMAELPDIEDPDFLEEVGVPEEESDDPWAWNRWTAAVLHRAITAIVASSADTTVLARCIRDRERAQARARVELAQLEQQAERARVQAQALRERSQQRRLPDAATRETICQYETHVSRQLQQALDMLERLQLARAG